MDNFEALGIQAGQAICYSGFRDGQQPGGAYPTYNQVRDDLLLLKDHWRYLRLYDCDKHGQTVLEVIEGEGFDFKILMGAYIEAEMNNYNCPWHGGVYSAEQLEKNKKINNSRINKLIELANQYPQIIFALSVGNEACVEWTDHYVPPEQVARFASLVKAKCKQPVTFCENYVPWLHSLDTLVDVIDFISIHTYPVWEYKHLNESIEYTKANYYAVADKYPNKPVIITEAGWATNSNGRGIDPAHVGEEYQQAYYHQLMEWTSAEHIPCFFFEAFDENWKGSPEPLEPEKHWGLFRTDRSPKLTMQQLVSR